MSVMLTTAVSSITPGIAWTGEITMAQEGELPASPCVRNCCLDQQDVCVGCFRTLREIRDWYTASADERRVILANCAKRRTESLERQRAPER